MTGVQPDFGTIRGLAALLITSFTVACFSVGNLAGARCSGRGVVQVQETRGFRALLEERIAEDGSTAVSGFQGAPPPAMRSGGVGPNLSTNLSLMYAWGCECTWRVSRCLHSYNPSGATTANTSGR